MHAFVKKSEKTPRRAVDFGRAPNRLETEVVRLAEVQEAFRVGERDVLAVVRETRAAMVEDLMGRLREGKVNRRNLESQRRSAFKGGRGARSAMRRALRGTAEVGFEHVAAEVERLETM